MIDVAMIRGILEVTRIDAATGLVLQSTRQRNRVYKEGVEILWQRSFGVPVQNFTHLAAGISGNPNNEAMTALVDEQYRAPLTSFIWDATNEEWVVRQIMGKTAGNGYTFREAMITNGPIKGAGTMLCRAVYPDQVKDANIILTFNWRLKATRDLT